MNFCSTSKLSVSSIGISEIRSVRCHFSTSSACSTKLNYQIRTILHVHNIIIWNRCETAAISMQRSHTAKCQIAAPSQSTWRTRCRKYSRCYFDVILAHHRFVIERLAHAPWKSPHLILIRLKTAFTVYSHISYEVCSSQICIWTNSIFVILCEEFVYEYEIHLKWTMNFGYVFYFSE